MVCSFCAQGISKSFEKIPVINSININLENKTVELFLAPHTKISDQSIITVIKESGYNVERIER